MSQAGIVNLTGGGGGGSAILSITGNDGTPEYPTANNFNIVTANATVKFLGTTSTETLNFGLSSLVLGSSLPARTTETQNTGFGFQSLISLTSGSANTAIGFESLRANTTSSFNVGLGFDTFLALTSGNGQNTALGSSALISLISGDNNISVGFNSGSQYTGSESSNILIGSLGVNAESHAIHIGTQGAGTGQQNQCFIAGIIGVTPSNQTLTLIDSSAGQLGNLPNGSSGQVLTIVGGVPTWETPASNFQSINVQTFTYTGSSQTYTPTSGMLYCTIRILGGGGGGGGSPSTSGAQTCGGSGGGSGEYAEGIFSAATIGASQTITIGAAGAANSGANGGNGGNTNVGSIITANGGTGGVAGTSGTGFSQQGSLGGTGGSGGSVRTPGEAGYSAAGSVTSAFLVGGEGGSSQLGAGGLGTSVNGVGNAALGYGGGGSGALAFTSQSAKVGGVGTAGIVIITEYIS